MSQMIGEKLRQSVSRGAQHLGIVELSNPLPSSSECVHAGIIVGVGSQRQPAALMERNHSRKRNGAGVIS